MPGLAVLQRHTLCCDVEQVSQEDEDATSNNTQRFHREGKMADEHRSGSGSFVSIKGHPIHPMLIPFPIAFLVGAFVSIGFSF